MENKKINEQLKKHIKEYVQLMVNPNYADSNFQYYGPYKISEIKSYIDQYKQEIDINATKEYLNIFGIKIFDNDMKNIEIQLAGGGPKNFEEDLELLFKEKVFSTYGTNIYDIPTIAENRIKKILNKYNEPIEKLVDDKLLARLAITTNTVLIHNGETDEGYPSQSTFKIGINFLAIEIIKKVLSGKNQKIEDVLIGKNAPFETSITIRENEKLYIEKINKSTTVFQTLIKDIGLYNYFQYGNSYEFSENYYSESLGLLNVCLKTMSIDKQLIEDIKPELININKFIKDNKGFNTHALKQIENNVVKIAKTINVDIESEEVKKSNKLK